MGLQAQGHLQQPESRHHSTFAYHSVSQGSANVGTTVSIVADVRRSQPLRVCGCVCVRVIVGVRVRVRVRVCVCVRVSVCRRCRDGGFFHSFAKEALEHCQCLAHSQCGGERLDQQDLAGDTGLQRGSFGATEALVPLASNLLSLNVRPHITLDIWFPNKLRYFLKGEALVIEDGKVVKLV